MSNKWIKYNTEAIQRALPELQHSTVEIYFDTSDEDQFTEITTVFKQSGAKRIKRLIAVILKNEYHDHIYKKEEGDIAVIKLISGQGEYQSYHIRCREILKGGKKLVVISSCEKIDETQ